MREAVFQRVLTMAKKLLEFEIDRNLLLAVQTVATRKGILTDELLEVYLRMGLDEELKAMEAERVIP